MKFFLIFLLPAFLTAGRIKLIHADRMEATKRGAIVLLVGNVHLREGVKELTSSSARWDQQKDNVVFRGNVTLADAKYTLVSRFLFFSRLDNYASANDSVVFIARNRRLIVTGKSGEYFGAESLLVMQGKPVLDYADSTDSSTLTLNSKRIEYSSKYEVGKAIGSVRAVIQFADTAKHPISIECDSVVYLLDVRTILAYGDVRITEDSITATGGFVRFVRDSGKIYLTQKPQLTDPNSTLTGGKMVLETENGSARRLDISGAPRGVHHDPRDPRQAENTFTAKTMRFEFENSELSRAFLIRESVVDYFPIPSDSAFDEHIHLTADSIMAAFSKGRMNIVQASGGIEGRYDRTSPSKAIWDTLRYSGNESELNVRTKDVSIEKDAKLAFRGLTLSAYSVSYNVDSMLLKAEGLKSADSLIEPPILVDKEGTLTGERMAYSLKNGHGKVYYGKTTLQNGFYWGETLKKSTGDTIYAASANYTTCDADTPHYHFHTAKMKLIARDKAIVRPVVLYIHKLPVFYLPFFLFSVRTKRHSGILPLELGQFQKGQRFVRNLGYYLAPSDYYDIEAAVDFDEETGWRFHSRLNYALRYHFSGYISGIYALEQQQGWESTISKKRYEFRVSHTETFGDKTRLSANGSFVSDKSFLTETSTSPQQNMNRDLHSSISLTTKLAGISISAALDRNENLETGAITEYLPKISLYRFSSEVFPTGGESKWFNKLTASYSGLMVHYRTRGVSLPVHREGFDNSVSLSLPIALKYYVTISPQLSSQLILYDRDVNDNKFPVRLTYSGGISMSTNLYGTMSVGLLSLKAFKHSFSPSIRFSYRPKFENMERFPSFDGISGGGNSSESKTMSVTLGNTFSAIIRSDDSDKKVALFNITSSFSYDFNADDRKLSDIQSSASSHPAPWLDFSLSAVHTPYKTSSDTPSGFYLRSVKFTTRLNKRGNISFGGENRDWNFSLTHYLSKSFENSSTPVSQWIKGDISSSITKKWRVQYNIYYDIDKQEKVSDGLSIRRDMHCWEGIFEWNISGFRQGYYFKVNVKDIPEIKIEGSSGAIRGIR